MGFLDNYEPVDLLFFVGGGALLFFLFRVLNLWYWRINELQTKLSRIIELMELQQGISPAQATASEETKPENADGKSALEEPKEEGA